MSRLFSLPYLAPSIYTRLTSIHFHKLQEKSPKDKGAAAYGSNPNRKLPTAASKKKKEKASSSTNAASNQSQTQSNAASAQSQAHPPGYSAQQAAVNDMMRRALEEDQYSALGSVVDTDSSDDEDGNKDEDGGLEAIRWNHRPKRGNSNSGGEDNQQPWMGTIATKLDRHSIQAAMRKHLRLEGMKSVRNFDDMAFLDDAEDYVERGGGGGSKRVRSLSPQPSSSSEANGGGGNNVPDEDLASDGRRIGKRRKKKKGKRGSGGGNAVDQSDLPTEAGGGGDVDTPMGTEDEWEENAAVESSVAGDDDGEYAGEEMESSIFGQTEGASNATWVECDRCKKVRSIMSICFYADYIMCTIFMCMSCVKLSRVSSTNHQFFF